MATPKRTVTRNGTTYQQNTSNIGKGISGRVHSYPGLFTNPGLAA